MKCEFISVKLLEEHQLSVEKKPKPDMSVEDPRCLDTIGSMIRENYPTERQRAQMSLLLLLSTFTAS